MSGEALAARLREAMRSLAAPPARPERWRAAWLVRALSEPDNPTAEHFAVAARCLTWAASDRNPHGPDPTAERALHRAEDRARLAALLLEQARRLAALLPLGAEGDRGDRPPGDGLPVDGLTGYGLTGGWQGEESARWDETLATVVEQLGDAGQLVAVEIRARSQERHSQAAPRGMIQPTLWLLWLVDEELPESPRWVHLLGRLLWVEALRARLEVEHRKPPALVRSVLETLADVQRPGNRLTAVGGSVVLADRRGRHIAGLYQDTPVVSLEAIDTLIHTGTQLLTSLNAHRTLRWMLAAAHRRVLDGEQDARVLKIQGGWARLTELVGARSKKGQQDIKAIVTALASFRFHLPNGVTGNLLAHLDTPAVGRRPASLEITLGTALLPHYVFDMPRGQRALVPMPALPPMVGRERDHGPQAALQLYLMIELRSHAQALASDGSVEISPARWAELAREAGMVPNLLGEVVERWTRDGEDGPAFLTRISPDRYTLAPAHRPMLDFLIEAGELESTGAEAGRRSANRKRGRLLRKDNPAELPSPPPSAEGEETADEG